MVGLNDHTGYTQPSNAAPAKLGLPFLYYGFLPSAAADHEGLSVNGHDVRGGCDGGPDAGSYLTQYANYQETDLDDDDDGDAGKNWKGFKLAKIANKMWRTALLKWTVCSNVRFQRVPSGRRMPDKYFMQTEGLVGKCRCRGFSDQDDIAVTNTAIGFR